MDGAKLMNLKHVVVILGLVVLATAVVLAITDSVLAGFLVAIEAFAFVVAALIYRAESRPPQRHTMK
jgi:hypothetical protein